MCLDRLASRSAFPHVKLSILQMEWTPSSDISNICESILNQNLRQDLIRVPYFGFFDISDLSIRYNLKLIENELNIPGLVK